MMAKKRSQTMTATSMWASAPQRAPSLKDSLLYLLNVSCPKLLFACIFHFALTLRTGLHIPDTDVIAATLQAQTAHLTSERWGYVCNDTTHHKVLDGMAMIARYGRYLLTEQTAPFVHLSLIATGLTAIFPFPCHRSII